MTAGVLAVVLKWAAIAIAAIGGTAAIVVGLKKSGARGAELEQAESETNEANRQADTLAASPLGGRAQLRVLDRLLGRKRSG